MASPQNIVQIPRPEFAQRLGVSTSPTATFHSPPGSFGGGLPQRGLPKQLKPFNTQDIKILLLENVNQSGRDILTAQGYQVEFLKTSLPEDKLIEKIRLVLFFFSAWPHPPPPPLPSLLGFLFFFPQCTLSVVQRRGGLTPVPPCVVALTNPS
jgi:hypothetical protein